MRAVLIGLASWLVLPPLVLCWAGRRWAAYRASMSPVWSVRGEADRRGWGSPVVAHTSDGGHEPRGGGAPDAVGSLLRGPGRSPRSSVPVHEDLLNYRPARENRGWCNDMALAGELDQWSQEGSR